jgi:hypothetical protein
MNDEAKAEQAEHAGEDAVSRALQELRVCGQEGAISIRVGAPVGIKWDSSEFRDLVLEELPGPHEAKRALVLERCSAYTRGLEGIAEELGHGAGSGYGLGSGPTSDVQVIGKLREEVRDLRAEWIDLRRERNAVAVALGMLPATPLGPPAENSALVHQAAGTAADRATFKRALEAISNATREPAAVVMQALADGVVSREEVRRNAVSPALYTCAHSCGWQGRKPSVGRGFGSPVSCPECHATVRRVPT